jgi:hypothetical protein
MKSEEICCNEWGILAGVAMMLAGIAGLIYSLITKGCFTC